MNDLPEPEEYGRFIHLLLHDLRNSMAALQVNIKFAHDALDQPNSDPEGALAALADCEGAAALLQEGMRNLGWWAASLRDNEIGVPMFDADIKPIVSEFRDGSPIPVAVEFTSQDLKAKNASGLGLLLPMLLMNAQRHASEGQIRITASAIAGKIRLRWSDTGPSIPTEHQSHVFNWRWQHAIREHRQGRYSLYGGMVAAGLLARSMGASMWVDTEDGNTSIIVDMPASGSVLPT